MLPGRRDTIMTTVREETMPLSDAITVAAIVAVFIIFGLVLAIEDYRTRHLPKPEERATAARNGSATIQAVPPARSRLHTL